MAKHFFIAVFISAFTLFAADEPLAKIKLKDVRCMAMNTEGKIVACGVGENQIHLWDVERARVEVLTDKFPDYPGAISISPDDRWLAAGGWQNGWACVIRIWDLKTRKLSCTIQGDWRLVYNIAFTPDSKHMVVGGFNRRAVVTVFDVATGVQTNTYPSHTGDACAPVAVSTDGKLIASGAEDGMLRVREREGGKMIYEARDGAFSLLRFSNDGKKLIGSSSSGEELWQWDVKTWKVLNKCRIESMCDYKDAISPDGRFALGQGAGRADLMSVESGAVVFKWTLTIDEYASASAFSGDSKRFAFAVDNGIVGIWNVDTVVKEK